MAVPTGSKIGVDFGTTSTTALFALTDRTSGTGDSQWVYAYVSGAAVAGDCMVVSATGTAAIASIALAVAPANEIAFATTVISAGDYAWLAKSLLGATIAVSATTAPNLALYIGTTSGKLSTTGSSATVVGVAVANVSSTATTTTTTGTITWPKIGSVAAG